MADIINRRKVNTLFIISILINLIPILYSALNLPCMDYFNCGIMHFSLNLKVLTLDIRPLNFGYTTSELWISDLWTLDIQPLNFGYTSSELWIYNLWTLDIRPLNFGYPTSEFWISILWSQIFVLWILGSRDNFKWGI